LSPGKAEMEKFWENIQQGNKKKLFYQAITGVVLIILAIGVYFMIKPRGHRASPRPEITTHKEELTRESWLATATKRLEEQQRRLKQMEKKLKEIQNMAKSQKETPPSPPPPPPPSGNKQKQASPFIPPPPPPPAKAPTGKTSPVPPAQAKQQVSQGITVESIDLIAVVKGSGEKKVNSPVKTTIRQKKKAKENIENTIPAGSFTSGILLSGLDAPTGGKASSSPHPVLIRLTDLTVLPNKFYSDIKSCFVIGEGYGDLSSERAYIRLNTLSCVKEDTSILERKIEGYISGEDGKIGLKGRVVSKQGALLARTLVAGFLEGASKILQQRGTYVSISPLGSTETVKPGEVTRLSMYSGVAEAAKKLSDFYMKLVNETFPVVEITAGRKVEIVFLKKVNLEESP